MQLGLLKMDVESIKGGFVFDENVDRFKEAYPNRLIHAILDLMLEKDETHRLDFIKLHKEFKRLERVEASTKAPEETKETEVSTKEPSKELPKEKFKGNHLSLDLGGAQPVKRDMDQSMFMLL